MGRMCQSTYGRSLSRSHPLVSPLCLCVCVCDVFGAQIAKLIYVPYAATVVAVSTPFVVVFVFVGHSHSPERKNE